MELSIFTTIYIHVKFKAIEAMNSEKRKKKKDIHKNKIDRKCSKLNYIIFFKNIVEERTFTMI